MADIDRSAAPVVLVLDDYEGLMASAPGTTRMKRSGEIRILDRPLVELPDHELVDVHAVVALRERTRFDEALLRRLPSLELVLQTGAGANHIDSAAMSARGVAVAMGRAATVGTAAVPELVLGLMVAAARHFPVAERSRKMGEWPSLVGRTLRGRRLGILGMGRIGTHVARLGVALGMDVVAWDRRGESAGGERGAEDGVERLSLDTLLSSSDVVSVHLRLTPQSRGLLDRARLTSMRPGSILVNTSRGGIVDQEALVDALIDGPLAAAGLDVFVEEPLPAGHPLRELSNVVLTPHVGWTVEEAFAEFAQIAADQLEAYLGARLSRRELLDPAVTHTGRYGDVVEPENGADHAG